MAKAEKVRRRKIRTLNDKLRTEGIGGQILITQGVQSLPEKTLRKILPKIRNFDAFNENNDPYKERDCAAIKVDGETIFWKIDYYDRSLRGGSPDAADPRVTKRVLTIMLSSEY